MSEITHQKARSLLQAFVDQMLNQDEKSILEAHLDRCQECREYASNLSALEANLRKTFHSTWDRQQIPQLNPQTILKPSAKNGLWNTLFGRTEIIGKAATIAALVIGYFVIANLLGVQSPGTNEKTATVLPTPNEFAPGYAISPTPSAQLPQTEAISQNCETVTYIVKKDDTLASIAFQHGILPESIMKYNHLNSEMVFTGMELVIPLCNNTPDYTATLLESTTTITPSTAATQ